MLQRSDVGVSGVHEECPTHETHPTHDRGVYVSAATMGSGGTHVGAHVNAAPSVGAPRPGSRVLVVGQVATHHRGERSAWRRVLDANPNVPKRVSNRGDAFVVEPRVRRETIRSVLRDLAHDVSRLCSETSDVARYAPRVVPIGPRVVRGVESLTTVTPDAMASNSEDERTQASAMRIPPAKAQRAVPRPHPSAESHGPGAGGVGHRGALR